jgi:hypothetical protein
LKSLPAVSQDQPDECEGDQVDPIVRIENGLASILEIAAGEEQKPSGEFPRLSLARINSRRILETLSHVNGNPCRFSTSQMH